MGKFSFSVVHLSSRQAEHSIRSGNFREKNDFGDMGDGTYAASGGLVRVKGLPGDVAEISVEQSPLFQGRGLWSFFSVNRLDVRWNLTEEDFARTCGRSDYSLNLSPPVALAGSSSIAKVMTGDLNQDGRTDLMVRMSDGAAYVFQQKPGGVSEKQCSESYARGAGAGTR